MPVLRTDHDPRLVAPCVATLVAHRARPSSRVA